MSQLLHLFHNQGKGSPIAGTAGGLSFVRYISPTFGVEKAVNGSMETGSPPSNWTASNATLTANADAHGGSQSLNIVPTAGEGGATQTFAAVQWTIYNLDFWGKVVTGNGRVRIFGANVINAFTDADWAHKVVSRRYDSASGNSTWFIRGVAIADQVRFDDVSLKPVDLASCLRTQRNTRSGDVMVEALVDWQGGWIGGAICLDSATNPTNGIFWYVDVHMGKLYLDKLVNGAWTNVATLTITYGSSKLIRIVKSETIVQVYYDNVRLGTGDYSITDASVVNNTLHMQFSTYALNRFTSWSVQDFNYLITYFIHGQTGLYIGKSVDGLFWPFLSASAVYTPASLGVRDPSVMYKDSKYWVCHTLATDAEDNQSVFDVLSGTLLCGVTKIASVDFSGLGAVKVWGPEWFVDGDGSVHVFVDVSTDGTNFSIYETHPTNAEMTAWSEPVQVTGTGLPANPLDALMIKKDSTYYLWVKNRAAGTIEYCSSSTITSGFVAVETGDWAGWGPQMMEGQTLIKIGNTWRIYLDDYVNSKKWYSESSDDWATWTAKTQMSQFLQHFTIIHTPT